MDVGKDSGIFGIIKPKSLEIDYRQVFSKATPEEIHRSWRQAFTDPTNHNPDKFSYLVHGIKGMDSRAIQRLALLKEGGGDRAQDIELLEDPFKIAQKKIISASIIDQDHINTWGEAGLILSTPPENVLRVAREDVGTNFFDPNAELAKGKRDVSTVEELLQQTSSYQYNEVVLAGRTDGGEVKVKGMWVKVWEDGEMVYSEVGEEIERLARIHNLPLVRIIKKAEPIQDKAPEVLEDFSTKKLHSLAVQRNGLRYVVSFDKDSFIVVDAKREIRQMTREELVKAKGLIEQELSQEDKNKIKDQLAQLENRFDAFEYKRQNPPPDVLTDYETKTTYGFGLTRGKQRYVIDLKRRSLTVYPTYENLPKRRGRYYIEPFEPNAPSPRSMTKQELEIMKDVLLKELDEESRKIFEENYSQIEEWLRV